MGRSEQRKHDMHHDQEEKELEILLEAARRATWEALHGPRHLRSGRFRPESVDSGSSLFPAPEAADEDEAVDRRSVSHESAASRQLPSGRHSKSAASRPLLVTSADRQADIPYG